MANMVIMVALHSLASRADGSAAVPVAAGVDVVVVLVVAVPVGKMLPKLVARPDCF